MWKGAKSCVCWLASDSLAGELLERLHDNEITMILEKVRASPQDCEDVVDEYPIKEMPTLGDYAVVIDCPW